MRSAGLQELVLGGFEVFKDVTRIPIRPLTLLFGPNSAGKSAVEEALRLMEEICDIPRPFARERRTPFDWHSWHRHERLAKSWRRESGDKSDFVPEMVIGAVAIVSAESSLWRVPSSSGITIERLRGPFTMELVTRFRRRVDKGDQQLHAKWQPDADYFGLASRDIELTVDGDRLVIFEDGKRAGVNFEHPFMSSARISKDALKTSQQANSDIVIDGSWVWLVHGAELDEQKQLDVSSWLSPIDGAPGQRALHFALRELSSAFNAVLPACCRFLADILRAEIVPASRVVPSEEDLAFLLAKEDVQAAHPQFHIRLPGDPRYEELAASFAATVRPEFVRSDDNEETARLRAYGERVNRALIDHLFMERGYHLRMDYRVLLSPEEFRHVGDNPDFEEFQPAEFTLIVRLFLADAQSRRYAFSEVGSGLGYVLPVLAAACSGAENIVLIQQPELHLHPAMQAALGDVFIEASHGRSTMIIETHSEHVLLRILKRIRQRASNSLGDKLLSIDPDNIAVVYFDPRPDGTTAVKHLRISEDGEFLDRWPRGFFAERDQELWDE
jgi:AAA domain, putative AbiEii toxin, Type IV TA system/Protein of unknown function (DUF3696)